MTDRADDISRLLTRPDFVNDMKVLFHTKKLDLDGTVDLLSASLALGEAEKILGVNAERLINWNNLNPISSVQTEDTERILHLINKRSYVIATAVQEQESKLLLTKMTSVQQWVEEAVLIIHKLAKS